MTRPQNATTSPSGKGSISARIAGEVLFCATNHNIKR